MRKRLGRFHSHVTVVPTRCKSISALDSVWTIYLSFAYASTNVGPEMHFVYLASLAEHTRRAHWLGCWREWAYSPQVARTQVAL